jgi:hypothetical protein
MILEWIFCVLVFFVSGYRVVHDYRTVMRAGEIIRIYDDWAFPLWLFVALADAVAISSLIGLYLE